VKAPTAVGGGGGMGAWLTANRSAWENSPRPPRWSIVNGMMAVWWAFNVESCMFIHGHDSNQGSLSSLS
jgi:hypothetical protein